jgi:RNA polymerase sigma-70 factor (ECF subfamily)
MTGVTITTPPARAASCTRTGTSHAAREVVPAGGTGDQDCQTVRIDTTEPDRLPVGAEAPGSDASLDLGTAGDLQLVVAIARYDQDALAEVYKRHGGVALGLAKRLAGDHSLAEEIVQEVFLRIWNEPAKFDAARGSLRSYLLAQIHGRSVDLIRSESSRRNREEREARLDATDAYDLEREVWDLTLAEHVRDALVELPSDERSAIELAYFGGHTYREVAVLLDAPEGTVKSRIRSGLGRLRGILGEGGVEGSWAT